MIKIVHDSDHMPEDELSALIDRAAEYTAEREGLTSYNCEVSLFFADEEEMKQLNAMYRGIDSPTDVLSFPMLEISAAELSTAPVLLGDVVICREIAKKQAGEYGHSEERELAFLFTHGLLHLLGYDHEDDGADAMRSAEKEILENMGLSE